MPEDNSLPGITIQVDPETGLQYISESYKEFENRLTAEEARTKAIELFRVAGIGEACEGITKVFLDTCKQNAKGFKKKKFFMIATRVEQVNSAVGAVINRLEPLPDYVKMGWFFDPEDIDARAAIELHWDEDYVILDAYAIRYHAQTLFEHAEALVHKQQK